MKTLLSLFMTMFIATSIFSQTATLPAGSGTEADPYQIATLNNLYWITQNNSRDTYYIQTANIDASSSNTWDSGEGFSPISNFRACQYDGQNHTISGLFIDRTTSGIGMFGYMYEGAIVKNLGIINASVSSTGYNVGIIAASTHTSISAGSDYTTTILNCYVTGTVAGEYNVGGIAGSNNYYSLIKNSNADVTVNGIDYIQGGLVGGNDNNSRIINCYSAGTISGTYDIGGLAGKNQHEAVIDSCYSTANVTAQVNTLRGGLVGKNDNATIKNSYSTGNIEGDNNVGGFVGQNYNNGIIENCYSTGNATGNSEIGGFVGYNNNNSIITNSYSIGVVTGNTDTGGFLGKTSSNSTTTQSFWNTETSTQATSPAGIGKTTTEMNTMCTYVEGTDASWDFVITTANGTNDNWGMNASENGGYPFLAWQAYTHTESCCSWLDIEMPVITSTHADQEIDADENCSTTLPDYTSLIVATDNCTPTNDLVITQNPVAGASISGSTNTVTLSVTDATNNTETVNFNVEVVDNTDPTITCVENQTINLTSEQSYYTVYGTEFDPVATNDNCNVSSVVNDFNSTNTLANAHFSIGTTTIVWTVSDDAGNDTECSFNVQVNAYVGIENISNNEFLIYPNPTTGILTIKNQEASSVVERSRNTRPSCVSITDIAGKIITNYQLTNNNSKIDISNIPNGIYFIKIKTEKRIFINKIIKE